MCSSLANVYCKPTTPPTVDFSDILGHWSAFGSNASGRKIYVPAESVDAYKEAEFESVASPISFDWRTVVILAVIIAVPILYKKLVKKEFSPILLIVISAVFGILFFA